jgi:hypothetical protein
MDVLRKVFQPFDDGFIFKWIVVVLFVLSALAAILNALALDYGLLRNLAEAKFLTGVAMLVLAGAMLLASLAQALILLYRGAWEVLCLKAERYSLVRLFSKALRVIGEAYFLFFVVIAPGGCLAVWLGGTELLGQVPIPGLREASGAFMGGLLVLVLGILLAAAQLFVAYFLAEVVELLASIAGDVAALRKAREQVGA